MSFQRIALSHFAEHFALSTGLCIRALPSVELSSIALGASVISVSDDFFAEAENLLKVEPAPSLKGHYGPNGALYSGWESRRHNPAFDWCIIKLGTVGTVIGFDIDTSHFNGNEAPEVSVDALRGEPTGKLSPIDSKWTEILPKVPLGPNSRHLFKIPRTGGVNYVKLNMYPDGGIARFRVYGDVVPIFPANVTDSFDMAHVFAGGRVDFTSDQHFGVGSNLILPGRGHDMGDGWETKRSRQEGHKDWAIIRLGNPGLLEEVEIDTAHFKGNYPESCEVHALFSPSDINWKSQDKEGDWTLILPRVKLGPHQQHRFKLINIAQKPYSHVKVTVYPDGGIKRVRVIGRRSPEVGLARQEPSTSTFHPTSGHDHDKSRKATTLPIFPLTPEAFAPYGQVLQAYTGGDSVPKGVRVTSANSGSATKFHKLSILNSAYPEHSDASTGISMYRCKPLEDFAEDGTVVLTLLERHSYTNQAFIPLGRGKGGESLSDPAEKYLVVVARNGTNDQPDMETLRGFVATTAQGVVYDMGIWRE
ncbi:hypothetical protein AMATHDRAFT_45281 [Amanita thiersii Skay4041]|uniref:Allantoicase domain-containing protein n=1 Tax=Amanita thiersii Skay4041 TaxID=703135 RepID=A0A2A9P034_9AGAR|nr:hypothetical protein AMATHDRAFT_45281 [Amanita thiersii Skay4041]